jgi:two-component sensor histidine kinase
LRLCALGQVAVILSLGSRMDDLRHVSSSDDVYVTDELQRRPPAKTDYLREKLALQDLAQQMIDHPADVLPRLVDLALEMCEGTSAGLSLFEASPAPGIFRWHDLRGILAKFEGATTPRRFSPCGACLDLNTPILSQHPERFYTWIAEADISVPELLLVPLHMGGPEELGTLWVVADDEGHFNSGHSRVLTELAKFAGIAIRTHRTEQRLQQALEHQETLTREMSHRVKNVFALTDGMVRISARTASDPQEMARILSGRLGALALAHDLVRRVSGRDGPLDAGAALGNLIHAIVLPFENSVAVERARFNINGPVVLLGSPAANGLALVFHELATNSAKYGALTADDGFIEVRWSQQNGRVDLTWRERGGPIIEASPPSSGFGTTLAKKTVVGQLGGELSYDWLPEGVVVSISVPVESLN